LSVCLKARIQHFAKADKEYNDYKKTYDSLKATIQMQSYRRDGYGFEIFKKEAVPKD